MSSRKHSLQEFEEVLQKAIEESIRERDDNHNEDVPAERGERHRDRDDHRTKP